MSREKHKNMLRGIKQPLVSRTQRVRASRHNKPHTHRRFKMEDVIVPAGTPNAKRTVEEIRPGVVYAAGTVFVDNMAVVHRLRVAVGHQVDVKEPFERAVAAAPTGTWGKVNEEPKPGAPKPIRK